MFDLGSMAAKFAEIAIESERLIEHSTEEAAKAIQESAKTAIGTYRFNWPALAESTVARKGFDTPLFTTGALQESIEYQVHGREADVGTNIPYAKYQEFGTSRIPARPFIGGAVIECEDQVKGFLKTGLQRIF